MKSLKGQLCPFLSLLIWLLSPIALAQNLSGTIGGLSATPTRPSPSGSFWNPALIGFCPHTQIETNIAAIGGWLIFDKSGTNPNTQKPYASSSTSAIAPNPFLAISTPLGFSDLRFGYATYFPGGAIAEFDDKGSQRYDIVKGLLIPWHHQLTVAYRPIPEFSVGLAGIYSVGAFESDLDIDLSHFANQGLSITATPAENESLTWHAHIPLTLSHSFGAGLGAFFWPSYQWSFGLSIYTPIAYEFSTPLEVDTAYSLTQRLQAFRALGADDSVRNEVKVRTTLPWVFQGGIRYQPYGYWTMEYFGRYALNSLHPGLSIDFQDSSIQGLRGYNQTGPTSGDTFLLGTVQSLPLWQHWTPGLTTQFYKSGVEDNQLSLTRADFDTWTVGAFAHYKANNGFNIGFEYSHSFMLERMASNTSSTINKNTIALYQPANTDGRYRASLDRLALMVNYAF